MECPYSVVESIRQSIRRIVPSGARRSILRSLSNPLKVSNVTTERPIFIWGVGRSGTFLLQDIMSLHPDLCTLTRQVRPQKGLWGDMHHGNDTPEKLKTRLAPHEGFQYVWHAAGIPLTWKGVLTDKTVSIDAERLIEQYETFSRRWLWQSEKRKKRILDKAVTYMTMVDCIDSQFPDAYHIFCIRDPRAVVNSILRLWRFTRKSSFEKEYTDGFFASMYPPGYEQYLGRALPEILSWQIYELIGIGFRNGERLGDRLIPFRYEELLKEAHAAVANLFRATELSDFPGIDDLIPSRFPDYSPHWPTDGEIFETSSELAFSSDELRGFPLVERMAASLGYDERQVGRIVGSIAVDEITQH